MKRKKEREQMKKMKTRKNCKKENCRVERKMKRKAKTFREIGTLKNIAEKGRK